MTFKKAEKLLQGGFPIRHNHYGVLHSVADKESLFARVGSDSYQKKIITGLSTKIWLLQPNRHMDTFEVVTSLGVFTHTKKWRVAL